MIASITGTVTARLERSVTVNVQGLGLNVFLIPTTIDKLPIGEVTTLVTHLHIREDAWEIYGFIQPAELALFERLLTVSGVGPRVALGVLSAASVPDLEQAIDQGHSSLLTKVSGVGKKTAERIIVDLRGKLAADHEREDSGLSSVIDALISLGYTRREARDAATATPPDQTVEQRIKAALRRVS